MSTAHAPSYVEDGLPQLRYQLYHEEKAKGGLALTMFGGSSSVAPDSPSSFGQIDICQRPDHPGAAGVRRPHPRARLRADDPDHPCRAAHALGHRRLAAHRLAPRPLREHQHRSLPQGDGDRGHPARAPAYGDGGAACEGGRARRARGDLLLASAGPVLVADHEPSHRRLWRQPREPGPLHAWRCSRRSADAVGPDYIVGIRMSGNEMLEGGLAPGGERRDRASGTPQSGPDRLRQRGRRRRLDRSRDLQADPDHGPAHGALPRTRPRDPRRDRAAGVPRHADHRPRARRRHVLERGLRRHGRHDPRPHRRPAHRGQADARRGGPDPALRRRRLLHRPDLCRRRRALHPQPGHRPRARPCRM